MKFASFLLAAAVALAGFQASAHEFKVGGLTVHHPAVNATPPGAKVAVGYFDILNNGKDADRLLAVSAPDAAARAELHSMTMDDKGVMKMRRMDTLDIPAGQDVALKPDGIHIMFMGLKSPLADGGKFPATLTFEKAGNVRVEFNVEPIGTRPQDAAGHGHEPHGNDHR